VNDPNSPFAAPPATHPFDLPGYTPTDDEKTWALISHAGAVFLGFLAPLIGLLAKGNDSKWVRAHAIESLNFNITMFIVYSVSGVLSMFLIGLCILVPALLAATVLSILAGVQSFNGKAYRYPFALRLIKD
jgi:uncharacterized Tic20 family protein